MKKVALFATGLLLVACGQQDQTPAKQTPAVDPQVINGNFSEQGARPYQIALLKRGRQFCGGTIIAKNWVVTAAHCVARGRAAGLSVRGGSLNSTYGGQEVKVKRVIPHPEYEKGHAVNNDIALLELSSNFRFDQNVSPAALPTAAIEQKYAAPGNAVVISGWGRYNGDSTRASTKLREAPLKVLTNEACSEEFKKYGGVTETMICGAANSKGQTGCNGDSGGPFVGKANNKFFLFGAVSWGGGGKCTSSTVFSRVAHLQPWITKTSGVQPDKSEGGGGGGGGGGGDKVYEGNVNTSSSSFQPNSKGFDHKGGALKAKLSSNASGDFDLYLQKKEGVRWIDVDSSTNEGHNDSINYNAPDGKYRWEVYAYDGSGKYKLAVSK